MITIKLIPVIPTDANNAGLAQCGANDSCADKTGEPGRKHQKGATAPWSEAETPRPSRVVLYPRAVLARRGRLGPAALMTDWSCFGRAIRIRAENDGDAMRIATIVVMALVGGRIFQLG